MNFVDIANTPGVQLRINCTFCPEEADGDLTIEVEPGMFIPFPICEGCLVVQAKNLNMIDEPVK